MLMPKLWHLEASVYRNSKTFFLTTWQVSVAETVFVHLFTPIKVNNFHIKNRIMLPALTLGYANFDGTFSEELFDFYATRIDGGVGAAVIGGCFVEVRGKTHPRELGLHSDHVIDSYRRITRYANEKGAIVLAQLTHGGRYSHSIVTGCQPVAPSAIPSKLTGEVPKELTKEEIKEIISAFGDAARRAYEAGFHGVEILAGTGYLISEFLSPITNKRTDEYGGSLENRMRFLLEVVNSVRKSVRSRFIVGVRLSADDLMGGVTIEDTKVISKRLESEGIDYISVSVGWHESPKPIITREVPQAGWVHLAYEIKRVVSIPVVAGLRIKSPVVAEDVIAKGLADMVAMARALLVDPELPIKAMEGRLDEIRPCIGCLRCLSLVFEGQSVTCSVNPRLTRERTKPLLATKVKNVVVVGGGPAGMEAALTLAMRGHKVTLIEKNSRLGGTLNIASKPPYKSELAELIKYYEAMLKKYGVNVILGVEAVVDLIAKMSPDVVVVATGGVPRKDVPGATLPHVRSAHEVLEKEEVLKGSVVVVGGGGVGLETADYLSEHGAKVTVVEMLDRVGLDLESATRWVLLSRLRSKGVQILTKTKVKEIKEKMLVVERSGVQTELQADYIVLAIGIEPNNKLYRELLEKSKSEIYAVGDCTKPGRIADAVSMAYNIAITI
jgi:2,4-dienoyl-CoA reductase (NADPH2)